MKDSLHSFSIEENKRFWDSNQTDYFGARHAKSIYFLCRPYIGTDILDAGAGDGSMMRALKKFCPSAHIRAVDLSPKSDEVQQADLTALPYADNSFDTILFMEVIEHLTTEDIQGVMAQLHRVLRPNGHLILTTPYQEDLRLSQVCCPACATEFHRYGHQHSFNEKDIADILKRAGLTKVDSLVIKMNRIKRFRLLGARFLKSAFMQERFRKAKGKVNLICVAEKNAM